MRTVLSSLAAAAMGLAATSAAVQEVPEKPLLGIVSIAATEANNARFIRGVEMAAEARGWAVSVIDAQGSAVQADAGIQSFVQRGARAIVTMVFPVYAIGAGLAAADVAGVPVVTWGGGLGGGVVATNGSGGPMAAPIVEMMIRDLGGRGDVLALTNRTSGGCRAREAVLDERLAGHPGIKVTKNEVRIPGYFEDGAQNAAAWLILHPAGGGPLAIWGCWDDPAIGAVSALRQQGRDDVLVYGINGNAQALQNIQKGYMTATAWQNSLAEGHDMVGIIAAAIDAGDGWQPKAVEVPPVVVTGGNVEQFLEDHPDALAQ